MFHKPRLSNAVKCRVLASGMEQHIGYHPANGREDIEVSKTCHKNSTAFD
jgi:hypothetical protein